MWDMHEVDNLRFQSNSWKEPERDFFETIGIGIL
jgi:hypothetical protein